MEKSTGKSSEKQQILSSRSAKELLALPGKKALRLILDSMTPARLVQSLAEEDLYWLVQDIGPEDALPVLSRASNKQWQYLLDLEVWHKDRVEIDSVDRWLSLFLKADPERFVLWSMRECVELLELYLFKHIDVRVKEEDESASDFGDSYFTLDGVFYIRVLEERYQETIRAFLERLAGHELERFNQILMELSGVLPAEVEENLYRLRNVRLAEKGFLPFEEAVGIYQYVSPQSLIEKKPEVYKKVAEPDLDQPMPVTTALFLQDRDLFYMALKSLEGSEPMERLQIEFAAMCNQITSADGLLARKKEDLATVVRKACGYLDIGLQELTDGDPQEAASWLTKLPLDQIFRVGYGAGLELKWKVERWIKECWFLTKGFGLSFWDGDWGGVFEGLLKKRPLFYTAFSERGEPYREFKSMNDIRYCHGVVDQVMNIDHVLSLVFADMSLTSPVKAHQPVNYKNLLLTCWAQYYLGVSELAKPLSAEELKTFFQSLWVKGDKPYWVDEKMKHSFLRWLAMRSGLAVDEVQGKVSAVLDGLFRELEDEYGSVSLEDLDPRYVSHLLT